MIGLKDSKLLFSAGSLKCAYIQNDALAGGYVVLFDQTNGKKVVYRNQRSEEPKIFKKLDSAVNAVKAIGFDSVTVCKLHG